MWTIAAALAAPVVHPGVPEADALARARWAARDEAVESYALPGLDAADLQLAGAATWTPCAGAPADDASVGFVLDRVDGALAWDRREVAAENLEQARERLSCHPSPPAALVARYHALCGVLVAVTDGDAAALPHFAQARRADPELAWGDGWPAQPTLLDRALLASEATQITAVGPLWLDGLPLAPTESVRPGGYHLRTEAGTGWLTLTVGKALLFVPSAVRGDLADPAVRPSVDALLAWHLGDSAWVVTPDAVWSARPGAWEQREALRRSPWIPRGLAVTGLGAALALGGAVPALVAVGRAQDAASDVSGATSYAAWTDATAAHAAASADVRRWRAVAAVGGGVSAAGVGLVVTGLRIGPQSARPRGGE